MIALNGIFDDSSQSRVFHVGSICSSSWHYPCQPSGTSESWKGLVGASIQVVQSVSAALRTQCHQNQRQGHDRQENQDEDHKQPELS